MEVNLSIYSKTELMKHYNNYYVKFDDDELRQILKEISNEEVKERIRSALGETIDPIDKFHATIAYYNNAE